MRRLLSLAGGVALAAVLVACGGADSAGGIPVEARQSVLVASEPLGDIVEGEMEAGDAATALCFVPEASTNTGATGAAIKIKARGLSGYAAVTDFPDDPANRLMLFDVNESELRTGLPSCP